KRFAMGMPINRYASGVGSTCFVGNPPESTRTRCVTRSGCLIVKRTDARPHGVTTNCESMQAEYAGDLVNELHHALLGIVAARHGSGQPVPRQVDRNDAELITELFCPRLPGIERGIGTVNEKERKRVARATVPDMGTRSVLQP